MSDFSQRKEIDAFFNFFATFNLARPVTTVADLTDGAALFEVLALVYVNDMTRQFFYSDPQLEMPTTFDNQPVPPHNRRRTGSCVSAL